MSKKTRNRKRKFSEIETVTHEDTQRSNNVNNVDLTKIIVSPARPNLKQKRKDKNTEYSKKVSKNKKTKDKNKEIKSTNKGKIKQGKHRKSLSSKVLRECTEDICHICQEWGDLPTYSCELCFHGFHTNCVKKWFENNELLLNNLEDSESWNNCNEIGFKCANNLNKNENEIENEIETPLLFEFIGNSIKQCTLNSINCEKIIYNKDIIKEQLSLKWKEKYQNIMKQEEIKWNKKINKNNKNKGKNKNKNKINKNDNNINCFFEQFNYEIERIYYNGFKHQNQDFMIGDCVEIALDNGDEICKILEIFKDNDTKCAWIKIQWFWFAKHVKRKKLFFFLFFLLSFSPFVANPNQW